MADTKIGGLDAFASSQLAAMQSSATKVQNLSTASSTLKAKTPAAHEKEIQKAGEQFEGLLVQEMLKEMWKTVPQGGLLDSKDEGTYQEMYQQEVAKNISEHRSIGVKDVIIRDIKATEARHTNALNKTDAKEE